jgi:prophage maintenance system killer protein
LQAQFTNHQEYTDALTSDGQQVRIKLTKGAYKEQPNNPRRPDGESHEYCPLEFTKEEMERLVDWYREAESKYPVEVRAAWLHHRFTQIHPFQDGNGRVARALASLVFLKEGLFPLVVRDSDRTEYISALEAADKGALLPLTQFFTRRQRDSILRALGLEQQVQQAKYADQIIASALQVLKEKYSKEKVKAGKVYEYATNLFVRAEAAAKEIAQKLDAELINVTPPGVKPKYHARVSTSNNSQDKKHYYYSQISEVAKQYAYVPSLDRYHSWVKMAVSTDEVFELIISIHGYGIGENGILAASAFTAQRIHQEEGGTTAVVNTHPSSTDLFQFNYIESIESTKKRFEEWLQSTLAIGLAEWKRRLVV